MVRNFKQRLLKHFTMLNIALGLPLLICLFALGSLLPRTTINIASMSAAAQIAETLSTNLALGRITLNPAFSSEGHKLQTQPVFFPIAIKAKEALVRRTESTFFRRIIKDYIATDIQLVLSPQKKAPDSSAEVYGTIVGALDSEKVGHAFQYNLYNDNGINADLTHAMVGQRQGDEKLYWSAFAPVFNTQGDTVAMVVVHSDRQVIHKFDLYSGLFAVTLFAIVIGLSIYLATKMANRLHNPIKNLHDGMLAFSEGDFSVRLPSPRTGDEMDDLINHFNTTSQQLRERLDMLQAMEMAADIQTKLLPTELPEIFRYDLAVTLQYAELAGGDYYDFIHLTSPGKVTNKWIVVLGDVTGHGVSAALLVAWLRATVRALAREYNDDLVMLVERLNASMLQDMNTGKFVTLFLAVIDGDSNQVSWLSAGHDPARLYIDDNEPQLLEACGPPIGVITTAKWEEPKPLELWRNDRLLIVTDGLQDAKSPTNERLGLASIDNYLKSSESVSAKSIKNNLNNRLEQHTKNTPLADDVTFIIIKRTP